MPMRGGDEPIWDRRDVVSAPPHDNATLNDQAGIRRMTPTGGLIVELVLIGDVVIIVAHADGTQTQLVYLATAQLSRRISGK